MFVFLFARFRTKEREKLLLPSDSNSNENDISRENIREYEKIEEDDARNENYIEVGDFDVDEEIKAEWEMKATTRCIHGYKSSTDEKTCVCNNGWVGQECDIDVLPSCNRSIHVTADDVLLGRVRVFDYQARVPDEELEFPSCDCVDECLEYLVKELGEELYLKRKAEVFYKWRSRCTMTRIGDDDALIAEKVIVHAHPLVLDRKERTRLRQKDDRKKYETNKPEKFEALEMNGPDGFQYPHNCPLNCSNRGTCKFHECECEENSYGLWCHYDEKELFMMKKKASMAILDKKNIHRAPKLKLSMLDIPGVVRRQRLGVFNRYKSFHYSYGYLFFMNALVRNKDLLAPKYDPLEKMTIPIIPYFNTDVLSSYSEIEYNQLVVEYVKKNLLSSEIKSFEEEKNDMPYTIWFTGQDRAFCNVNDNTRQMLPPRSIVMGLYGFHRKSDKKTCFDKTLDIVIPTPYSFVHGSSHGYGTGKDDNFDPSMKTGPLLFFSGNLKQMAANCTLENFFAHADECINYYSQGVRPWMHAFYKDEANFWINKKDNVTGPGDQRFKLEKQPISKFCLITGGIGHDLRLIDSISRGCVPLIAMRNESLAFDIILDYSQFSVKADLEHFTILPRYLREVNAKRYAKMVLNLRTVREAIAWHNTPLTEYEHGKHADSNFQVLNGAFAHSILALNLRTKTEIPESIKATLCEMYYRSKWNPSAFEILRAEAKVLLADCSR